MSMKTIKVSEPVHDDLTELKDEERHTSYDSLLRAMLREYKDE